jgi:hypothetical protein
MSPSQVWCGFEFLVPDSEQLRKSLRPVDTLPVSLSRVPTPGKSWWPSFLEGSLDENKIHDAGFELYIFEEQATSSATASELFVINWKKGQGFFYGPPV